LWPKRFPEWILGAEVIQIAVRLSRYCEYVGSQPAHESWMTHAMRLLKRLTADKPLWLLRSFALMPALDSDRDVKRGLEELRRSLNGADFMLVGEEWADFEERRKDSEANVADAKRAVASLYPEFDELSDL
jgi:hypothetical protein